MQPAVRPGGVHRHLEGEIHPPPSTIAGSVAGLEPKTANCEVSAFCVKVTLKVTLNDSGMSSAEGGLKSQVLQQKNAMPTRDESAAVCSDKAVSCARKQCFGRRKHKERQ